MTYTPKPDRNDVISSAGVRGAEAWMINSIPDHLVGNTTSGADVSPTGTGLKITPGTTSGDLARIITWEQMTTNPPEFFDSVAEKWVFEMIFLADWADGTAPQDEINIGYIYYGSDESDNRQEVGYEMRTGDYKVANAEATASQTPHNTWTYFRMEGHPTSHWDFYLSSEGVQEEVRVNSWSSLSNANAIAVMWSNGAGDTLYIPWHRHYGVMNI